MNCGEFELIRVVLRGVVILGLFKDPAGNLLGLVEMKDGKVKSP